MDLSSFTYQPFTYQRNDCCLVVELSCDVIVNNMTYILTSVNVKSLLSDCRSSEMKQLILSLTCTNAVVDMGQ